MNCVKISDAEFPLMEYIWANGPSQASNLSAFALDKFSWKKNTTYTVLKRLIERGALRRQEPGFMVYPLVTKQQVQLSQMEELIQKVFGGSSKEFLETFLSKEDISNQDLTELSASIAERMKQNNRVNQ